jgi:predicted Zn-dependent peptidase
MNGLVSRRFSRFAPFFLSLVLSAASSAQAPHPEIFQLPRYERVQLPNGLTLLLLERRQLPLISVELGLRSGSIADPPGKEGLASLTASLLRKGTATRTPAQVSSDLDFLAMEFDTDVDQDATRISVDFPSKDVDAALPLLGDILLRPAFPAEEVKERIAQMKDGIRAAKDDPPDAIRLYFMKFLYGDHPYGRPPNGDERSLAGGIARDDVGAFYRRYYTPPNAVLALAGDFNTAEMQSKIERIFAGWSGAAPPAVSPPVLKPVKGKRVLLVDKPDATQTYFIIGNIGISRTNADRGYLEVVNTLFGGRFTSLLNTELRIKTGYSYGAYSSFQELRVPGPFAISTFTKNETTEPAIDKSLEVLARLHRNGFTAEEIASANAYLDGSLPTAYETTPQLVRAMATLEIYGITREQFNQNLVKRKSTNSADARRMIDRYFPDENYAMVMIGKAAEIGKIAAKYSPMVTTKKIDDPGF